MRRIACLTAALLFSAAAGGANESQMLTVDGLGPVRIGMTLSQAEQVLGTKLDISYDASGSDACGEGGRADGSDPGIAYMLEQGKITRISIFAVDKKSPLVKTAKGIGIGSSEEAVRSAYGSLLQIAPRPYQGEPDHELTLMTGDHRRAMVFETTHGKVDEIRAGLLTSVQYWEGCA